MMAVSATKESNPVESRSLQEFAHAPNVIGYPGFHRRSATQALVDTPKVVPGVPENDGSPVMIETLRERICEPRKSTQAHSQGEIAALDYRSADTLRIGLPHDWDHLHGSDFGGRVPRFAFLGASVNLDELGEASKPVVQHRGDCRLVRNESVRRDLKRRACRSMSQAFHENVRGRLVALAHRYVQDELAMAFDSDEHVAVTEQRIVIGPNALLFFPNEAPHLIALQIAHRHVTDFGGHDAFALLADQKQELQNRGVMNFRCAFDTRNGIAFEQEPENHLSFLHREIHAVKRIGVRFSECLAAVAALVARQAVAVFAVLPAFRSAIVARHFGDLAFFEQERQNDSGRKNPVFGASPRLSLAGSSSYLRGEIFWLLSPISSETTHRLYWLRFRRDSPGRIKALLSIFGSALLGCSRFNQPNKYGMDRGQWVDVLLPVPSLLPEAVAHQSSGKVFRHVHIEKRTDSDADPCRFKHFNTSADSNICNGWNRLLVHERRDSVVGLGHCIELGVHIRDLAFKIVFCCLELFKFRLRLAEHSLVLGSFHVYKGV